MDSDGFKVTELVNDSDADLAASFPSSFNLGRVQRATAACGNRAMALCHGSPRGAGYFEPRTAHRHPPHQRRFVRVFLLRNRSAGLGRQPICLGLFLFHGRWCVQNQRPGFQWQPSTFSHRHLPLGPYDPGDRLESTSDPFQPGVHGFTVTRPGCGTTKPAAATAKSAMMSTTRM